MHLINKKNILVLFRNFFPQKKSQKSEKKCQSKTLEDI